MQDNNSPKSWSEDRLQGFLENQRKQHRLTPAEFKPIGADMKSVVKKIKITSKTKTKQIEAAWKTVFAEVNPSLARNSEIVSFRSGVLNIAIKSSTLFFEIQHFQKDFIIRKLREICSYPVLDVKFTLMK